MFTGLVFVLGIYISIPKSLTAANQYIANFSYGCGVLGYNDYYASNYPQCDTSSNTYSDPQGNTFSKATVFYNVSGDIFYGNVNSGLSSTVCVSGSSGASNCGWSYCSGPNCGFYGNIEYCATQDDPKVPCGWFPGSQPIGFNDSNTVTLDGNSSSYLVSVANSAYGGGTADDVYGGQNPGGGQISTSIQLEADYSINSSQNVLVQIKKFEAIPPSINVGDFTGIHWDVVNEDPTVNITVYYSGPVWCGDPLDPAHPDPNPFSFGWSTGVRNCTATGSGTATFVIYAFGTGGDFQNRTTHVAIGAAGGPPPPPPPDEPPPPSNNPTCGTMQSDSAVGGCSNYVEWAPVNQPTANACVNYCGQNGASACEYNNNNGDCYVEFGNSCTTYPHGGGWSAATLSAGECTAETIVDDSQYVSQSVPTTMVSGQVYPITVTMKNTGTSDWITASSYALGSQNPQDNTTWGSARQSVGSTISPNGQKTFSFNVTAPSAGTYNFQQKMVHDLANGSLGPQWFGQVTPNVSVAVNPAGSVPTVNVKARAYGTPSSSNSDGPISISYNTPALISWTSTNATSCSSSPGGWTGLTKTDQTTGNLLNNTTYTITCTNVTGSSGDSVVVSVSGASSQYSITAIDTTGGTIKSTDNIIDTNVCGSPCTKNYNINSTVTLTAIPDSSYWEFAGWAGDCTGTGNCVVSVNGSKSVTALFRPRAFNYIEF